MKKNHNLTNEQRIIARKNLKKEIWRHRELYLFLLPALVVLLIFSYGPMYGIIMAFQDVQIGVPLWENKWVGFKHFIRFFNGAWFGTTIKNTVCISLISNFLCWPFPLILALLLHNCTMKRTGKLVQNITYLPHLLSTVVIVSIIRLLCDGETGLINILLKNAGEQRINFFGDPKWVYPLYAISGVWSSMGYGAIVYLGALAAVDEELIEAAKVDGAGKLKRIWHIQLPTILPTVITMLILNMGKLFSIGADKMLLLQTDLNLASSEIIATYVYKTGVGGAQYGFATAVGLFQNIINLILVLTVNKISKKVSDTSLF